MATKLRSFSRLWSVKALSFLLFTLSTGLAIMLILQANFRSWLQAEEPMFPLLLALSAMTALLCLTHLLSVSGRRPNSTEVHLTPWDCIWSDVVLAGLLLLFAAIHERLFILGRLNVYSPTVIMLGSLELATYAAVVLLWILSAAARLKNGTFWRHTLIGKIFLILFDTYRQILSHCPVTLQIGLWGASISFLSMLVGLSIDANGDGEILFLALCLISALFGTLAALRGVRLSKAARGLARLRQGDYSAKLSEKGRGFLYQMSCDINHVREGQQAAVETAMRSERFKSELITNVSHDLRTPLTSIITYADLLKSEGLDGPDADRYLDVITQKARRLEALTCDLFEVSKAASGDMRPDLVPLDLRELLSQTMGEMNDRLESAQLDVRLSGQAPLVQADGRMLFRVLENLMGNIIKYALPGSRVYIDLNGDDPEWVTVTLRNISREPLPPEADRLTERFVRGDTARTSEGSGLGLAIVSSFMEAQKGHFTLTTDGDLFKVTLALPKTVNSEQA